MHKSMHGLDRGRFALVATTSGKKEIIWNSRAARDFALSFPTVPPTPVSQALIFPCFLQDFVPQGHETCISLTRTDRLIPLRYALQRRVQCLASEELLLDRGHITSSTPRGKFVSPKACFITLQCRSSATDICAHRKSHALSCPIARSRA